MGNFRIVENPVIIVRHGFITIGGAGNQQRHWKHNQQKCFNKAFLSDIHDRSPRSSKFVKISEVTIN